jgi:hypothetical protein
MLLLWLLCAGCDETSVVLLIRSNQFLIPEQLDAVCLQLSAGQRFQFGKHYTLGKEQAGVPLTLSVLPGSRPGFEALVRGQRRGLDVAWVRERYTFVEHEIQEQELFLRCAQRQSSGRFAWGGRLTNQGAAVAAVPVALAPNEAVVAWSGGSKRFVQQEDSIVDLEGGLPTTQQPVHRLLAVDVDGDCDLDLIALAKDGPQLWRHDEGGTFQKTNAIPLTDEYVDVAAADIDLHDRVDLVLVSSAGEVKLLLNNGTGTFRDASSSLPSGIDDVTSVDIGFINRVESQEQPGFAVVEYYPDIVLGRGITGKAQGVVLLNRFSPPSNLKFDMVSLPEARQTASIAVADLNGDKAHDVVLGNVNDLPQVYINKSTISEVKLELRPLALLNVSPDSVEDVLAADIDDDCDVDVVLARKAGTAIYLNDGQGTFLESVGKDNPLEASRVVATDMDGDGALDLILGSDSGAVWMRQVK